MKSIDWKQKLSSRKFWALIAALALTVGAAVGFSPETIQSISGIIGGFGAIMVYVLSEAALDKAREEKANPVTFKPSIITEME